MNERKLDSPAGIGYALTAYGCWGLMPLYFRAVELVPREEILAFRITMVAVILAGILYFSGRWHDFRRAVGSPRILLALACSTTLLAMNWYIYIYAIHTRQAVQTSLGYFINPLFNVALGVVIFRERLRSVQTIAIAIAAGGVAYQVWHSGEIPWIAISLALSFGLYSAIRKVVPVDGILGLAVETGLMLGPSMIYLAYHYNEIGPSFGRHNVQTDVLLWLSGPITAVPMVCFGQAARKLRLTTLGLIQYLAPSMQFVCAVWLLGEPLRWYQAVSFGLIWLALGLYSADAFRLFDRPVPETLPELADVT